MTILFSMRHSGALRNFASTVRALSQAGHRVHLVFMMPDKRGDGRLLRELTRECAGLTSEELLDGKPRGIWPVVARAVRTAGDYSRYWTPAYSHAHALRHRAAARVPPLLRIWLDRPAMRSRAGLALVRRFFDLAERAIPVDPRVRDLVAAVKPDVLLVTPLVDLGSNQVEYLKAARRLGVRSGLLVHSWDNLTNKGVIRVHPDRVFVWNETQRREAVTLHGVAPDQVVVTGAPVYDQWFARLPSTSREAFCRRVQLRADRPFLLYLCSSAFIAANEAPFVRTWIAAVRSFPDTVLREAGILIRPHPDNVGPWREFDAAGFANVSVWPRGGGEPIDRASRDDYFDSMYHAAAAVGLNTSAQIEAGIVGCPVYSIRAPEYADTQGGTLHFHYLLSEHGGLVRVADTFEEHARSLAGALGRNPSVRHVPDFVRAFVRPHGLEVEATPRLAAAIEELGALPRPAPSRAAVTERVVRLVLYSCGVAARLGRSVGRRVRRNADPAVLPVRGPGPGRHGLPDSRGVPAAAARERAAGAPEALPRPPL